MPQISLGSGIAIVGLLFSAITVLFKYFPSKKLGNLAPEMTTVNVLLKGIEDKFLNNSKITLNNHDEIRHVKESVIGVKTILVEIQRRCDTIYENVVKKG